MREMFRKKAFTMIECLVSLSVLSVLCATVCNGSRMMFSFFKRQKNLHDDYIRAAEADKNIRCFADGISMPFWEKNIDIEFHENVLSSDWLSFTVRAVLLCVAVKTDQVSGKDRRRN